MRFEDFELPRITEDGAYYSPYTYRDSRGRAPFGQLVCPSCHEQPAEQSKVRNVRVVVGYDWSAPGGCPVVKMADKPVYVCKYCAASIDEDLAEDALAQEREAKARLDEYALEHRMNQNWGCEPEDK